MNFPLVGNDSINLVITNALREKKLPHAIIIEGEIGTGRHTLSNFIAQAALCSGAEKPCDICDNCRLYKAGSHPDILITAPDEGKKNISVAQIKNLREQAYIKPHMASCRIFIIDCADTLNINSQNALLKILEEPPGAIVFILIAESKASLLETIISRCIVLTLNNPKLSIAATYIASIVDCSNDDILNALSLSKNNIGKALSFLKGKSDTKTVIAAKEFLKAFFENDYWGMLKATADLKKNRIEASSFFKNLKSLIYIDLRENANSFYVPCLYRFYYELCRLEKNLSSNINLSLLFATLASTAHGLMNKT